MTLDPHSYEPRYARIARLLRERITSGQLAPGQTVPSEQTLIQEHGVSRETVRRAIGILRNEGLVVTEPGQRSYVRDVIPEPAVVTIDAHTDVSSRMPSAEERVALGIPAGIPVFVVSRDGAADEVLAADRTVIRGE